MAGERRVVGVDIESDEIVGTGGFLAIRRLRLRNRYEDGGLSERYVCDFVHRDVGLDAVVVVVWARRPDGGVNVLIRDGLRPSLAVGREGAPLPDGRDYLFISEVVAGIIERGEHGEDGIRRRAAAEVLEEAGFEVDAGDVVMLGAAAFPSPGAFTEKFWLAAVEVNPGTRRIPEGDGSPMEEGASVRWSELDEAIAAGVSGELEDMKTELALRRLRDRLR